MSYCYWAEARDSVWHRVEQPDPKLASAKDGSDEFRLYAVPCGT